MKRFPSGHATHPQWRMAVALVLAQLRAQMALPEYASAPTLALLYITDHYASDARDILDALAAELPEVTDWAGTVGVGLAVNNAEYFDEPALAVMLCDLPPDQYRVFSGVAPLGLGFEAHTALVHADAGTPDVAELIDEMAARTDTGYLFGGLASSRATAVQFAVSGDGTIKGHGAASGVFSGGLSGVAFGAGVHLVSRVTQGASPVAPVRTITQVDGSVLLQLDGRPALDVLQADLGITIDQPKGPGLQAAIDTVRATLVGLSEPGSDAVGRSGNFGSDVLVRHIIGLDPARRGVAIAAQPAEGMRLAFCQRNVQAARADLTRICAEIREELESEDTALEAAVARALPGAEPEPRPARTLAGAVYVSCAGRGGPHFGGPGAELQIVRRALGDVPLVGFFAGGEIARNHLYGYTGVLTVFTD
ncbi:MAG: FIST C-terminal domain-containing protein [Comamonadaceae bacterium]|jgi:small ligand-binding sensory domain FIST|uniref:FIST signal transduction protein n=1 Tax=Candidatus Skiveiella danica TaxID=3386177 RepID=UPI001B3F568E|nr:FIST C-terminal domain-containing protein [Comamonadaceae bacterium]MBK7120736.1 FIST C-terminal domain-containing protein [Comamonadaceae bacterium]MBK8360372.1 FIST C-terminal domain-containing protein [Comamonadaceae bacterium]MBK9987638.1 FIST C-terminal domain-containing protein [Betaproteobacteria bacterium]MBP8101420.1 FIST C-terminal domain-containing protein [Burkholderiaceae bacterium]